MSETSSETTTTQPVTVSGSAAKRIREIIAADDKNTMFRVSVSGGGCSGFQYHFDLTDTKNDDDLVIEKDGATVLVDSVSLLYMENSEIDFVDALIGAAFQVNNPNATSSCGCGTSFSL